MKRECCGLPSSNLKHLQEVLPLHFQPDERLLLLDNGLEERLQVGIVAVGHLSLLHVHIVVVSPFDRGPVAQAAAVVTLHGLTQDVGTGVPEHLLP